MKYTLESFPYLIQTDNKWFSSTSCYPTSMAMAILWCLKISGYNEQDIDCPKGIQLEDYITKITESKETKQWINQNISKYGSWMLNYKPRTIAYVQEYIFNKLMNPLGFKSTFNSMINYETYCIHLKKSQMPIVLHGNFKTISPVAGHIICGIGYNNNSIICHDPYGNAVVDKYESHEMGIYAKYPLTLVMKDKKNQKMWGQIIEKI